MEVYEHVCDPLETVRILQMIVDLMALRPRLNMEATHFIESYKAATNCLKQRAALYKEFLNLQKDIEVDENKSIQDFLELKLRKIQESKSEFFRLKELADNEKKRYPGSDEIFSNTLSQANS